MGTNLGLERLQLVLALGPLLPLCLLYTSIVLCPCSTDQTVPYAEQIEQAGIRLVLADSTMDQPMGSAVVATDNYAAGYKLGSYMKQFVKADSVIGIVGHVKGCLLYTSRCV